MEQEVPLIWTTKGNVPIADLQYGVAWEETDTYIKFIETYRIGDEIVKQAVHVRLKQGIDIAGDQGKLCG